MILSLKYEGAWYEIMRLPNVFENGIKCNKGEHTLIDNRTLTVNISGYSL
jgi:lipocalin